MPTKKITVTIDDQQLQLVDRWLRHGLYANRSRAVHAALELLARRNALPTLEHALAHPRTMTPAEQQAWSAELAAIDTAAAGLEPALPVEPGTPDAA